MSAQELLSRLSDEMPGLPPVVPVGFLDDDLLPTAFVRVEPAAFALECALAAWGPFGPQN